MEMHTRKSLRRIHGIEARPADCRRSLHLLSYSECFRIAGRARSDALARLVLRAARRFRIVFIRRVVCPLRHKRNQREAVRRLQSMTDAELKDIGIARCEIHSRVYLGKDARR